MLQCEGYKMFRGTCMFLPSLLGVPAKHYHGTWLYKPDNRMWYLNGCPDYPFGTSFHADRILIVEDEG